MNKTLSTLAALSLIINVSAQNTADFKVYKTDKSEKRSAEKLMESLIGEGVVLKNFSITKTSGEEAFGFFEDSKERLGMKKGLVMTTGGIISMSSKNTSGSTSNNTHDRVENRNLKKAEYSGYYELEQLLKNKPKTFDACVIELDVVPTADTLSFNYVFGSEEYDEYVGSTYNDVFAFFISGEGISNEKNLAVVPNTEIPVSVNTINNGSGGSGSYKTRPTNSTFYVSNVDGHIGIEYDGMTKLMQIRQAVVPYKTYHLKLAIADVADDSYDSGVFIEGKSFVSYEKSYNVLYAKNEKEIEKGYKTLLDNLSKEYKAHPAGKIIVTGHTDEEGDNEFNMGLSCERANIVAAYLKSKGIEESRVVVDCKGETLPAYDNKNDLGKKLNRRVEVKIGGNAQDYAEKKPITSPVDENGEIKKSALIKNFPNPFIGSTTLDAYIVNETKQANIIISDLNGKQVKNIYVLEKGETTINFDATGLAKGIYTASLMVDGQMTNTLKMILQ
ncbi:MAG: choice-of-anchor L domain-containing protein [Bacteroidia bacterium]|nr:choice-of-anchor L domain-containing protein [Bacteroidia bacterium]